MIGYLAIGLSRIMRPYFIRWGIESAKRKCIPLARAKYRREQIERLAGGAVVDAAVEAALDAAETACEKFCRDHPDELQAIIDGKGNAEFKESWKSRYSAVEASAYNHALTEARKGGTSK